MRFGCASRKLDRLGLSFVRISLLYQSYLSAMLGGSERFIFRTNCAIILVYYSGY